jgi:hypothetical protein
MRHTCVISVANNYLRVYDYAEEFVDRVLKPFCRMYLSKTGMVPAKHNPRLQVMAVTHRFMRFNHDQSEIRFTSSLLEELKTFIGSRGYAPKRILQVVEPEIIPMPATINFKPGIGTPKDDQLDWLKYIMEPGPLKLNNAATGVGKTFMSIWTAVQLQQRVVIIANARFLPVWKVECGNLLDIAPEDYVETDVGGLDNFLAALKKGVVNPKIVVISLTKIDIMLKKSKADPLAPDLDDFYREYRPGLRVYDEAHESIHQLYLSMMFGNIRKTIANTATVRAEDPMTNKIYGYLYPKECRLKETEYSAHMHVKALFYRIDTSKHRIRSMARGVYNDTVFEASVMDNHKLQPQYIEMMYKFFDDYYYHRRRPGTKCLFFFTKVETCKIMVAALLKRYPDLDAISFTGEQGGKAETKDEYRKHEVVFSTPGSCGTGKDIPGLITCISFHNVKSLQRNYQMRGRIRPIKQTEHPDLERIYGYTVCVNEKKHKEYHKYRKELFEESSLSYQSVDSGFTLA